MCKWDYIVFLLFIQCLYIMDMLYGSHSTNPHYNYMWALLYNQSVPISSFQFVFHFTWVCPSLHIFSCWLSYRFSHFNIYLILPSLFLFTDEEWQRNHNFMFTFYSLFLNEALPTWPKHHLKDYIESLPTWPKHHLKDYTETLPTWPKQHLKDSIESLATWPKHHLKDYIESLLTWPKHHLKDYIKSLPTWPKHHLKDYIESLPTWPKQHLKDYIESLPTWPKQHLKDYIESLPTWPKHHLKDYTESLLTWPKQGSNESMIEHLTFHVENFSLTYFSL